MIQVAAALLFAVAAGIGITVILAMLKSNGDAILSALAGEGAFGGQVGPFPGPAARMAASRRQAPRRAARTSTAGFAGEAQFNRAA